MKFFTAGWFLSLGLVKSYIFIGNGLNIGHRSIGYLWNSASRLTTHIKFISYANPSSDGNAPSATRPWPCGHLYEHFIL